MINCKHTEDLEFRSATKSGNNQTGPNCVEVAGFRKASSSVQANCVEMTVAVKATRSTAAGHCVTVAHAKAARSVGDGHCVEAGVAQQDNHTDCTPQTCSTPGIQPGDVVVRDSKLGADSPLVVFRPQEWREYVATVIEGGMERDGADYVLRDLRNPGVVLRFNPGEEDAFRDGCTKGEFTYSEALASA